MLRHADGTPLDRPVVRLALHHRMRAWTDALERLLGQRPDLEVVAAHTDYEWVRHAVLTGRVDILLTQLELPAGGRITMLAELFEANPDLGVVALSDSQDRALLAAAVRAGVRGWIEPTASVEHVVQVLHGVARGETWFPPRLMTRVLDALLEAKGRRERAANALSSLTTRELEILGCLAQGMTRRQISELFVLSPHTVRTHINNVLRKLEVHSTLAAVSVARQLGLAENLSQKVGD
jgi:DNA-binding NarL/FixJ family response regulator